jgi:hypothetical protein
MWVLQAFADQLIMAKSGLLIEPIFDLCNLRFQFLGFTAQILFLSRGDLPGSAPEALLPSLSHSLTHAAPESSTAASASSAPAPSGGGASGFIAAGTVACAASSSASESIWSSSISSRHDVPPVDVCDNVNISQLYFM